MTTIIILGGKPIIAGCAVREELQKGRKWKPTTRVFPDGHPSNYEAPQQGLTSEIGRDLVWS